MTEKFWGWGGDISDSLFHGTKCVLNVVPWWKKGYMLTLLLHPYCSQNASSKCPIVWIVSSSCSSNAQLVCRTLCKTGRSDFTPGRGVFSLRHCSLCTGGVAGFGQCFAPPSIQSIRIDIFFTARREVPHLLFITALKLQPRPQALVTYAAIQKNKCSLEKIQVKHSNYF